MRKARIVIAVLLATVAGFAVVTTVFFTDDASAHNTGVAYEYHVGDTDFFGPDCQTSSPACPAVAEASNGDTIEIAGTGMFSVSGEANGGGTFTHNFSGGGSVSGTWVATELVSFKPYGPNAARKLPSRLPKEWRSGEAQIRVNLFLLDGSSAGTATLSIGCLLGPPRSYPRGAFEGTRLNIDGGLNFDMDEEGITLFIKL